MNLVLTDTKADSAPYAFQIEVINNPPRFSGSKPANQKVQLTKEFIFSLPSYIDDENNSIDVVLTKIPNYAQFNKIDNSFKLNPVDPYTCIGVSEVKGYITDSYQRTDFEFEITVYNRPPKFKELPKNLKNSIFTQSNFPMPLAEDEEGLPITYKINNLEGGSLPQFIKYNTISKSLTVKTNNEKD